MEDSTRPYFYGRNTPGIARTDTIQYIMYIYYKRKFKFAAFINIIILYFYVRFGVVFVQ